ncbi:hypothetical protein ACFLSQ_10015 [Bacteroidota bacterium]
MDFIWQTLFYGLVIGIFHYILLGILYMNPIVSQIYNEAQEKNDSVKLRNSTSNYLSKQFLGTQIEIWIITAGFLFLKQYLPFSPLETGFILGAIFGGIRIYERFWNMYIQTTYPKKLLVIEFINGIIGTFVITIGLSLLP